MTNIIHYKGYIGNVKEDKEIFYGKLEFINDLITFQGTSVEELKKDFHQAVDEYIEDCRVLGKEPKNLLKAGSLLV